MTGRCSTPSKTSFLTKVAALGAARTIRGGGGPSMRAYRCDCGKFHLTTDVR